MGHRAGLVAATVVAASCLALATALVIAHDMVLGFSDAPSHLLSARRVFDNLDPSLSQLGTHWAPLLHVLQLPLVWVTPLYLNGASGIAVSAGATLLTASSVYRMARLVGAEPLVAVAAVAGLCAQPAFSVSGAMPMLPALVMATTTTNVYYLTRWAIRGQGLDLLLSGVFLSLAVLTHFETWILLPVELVVIWVCCEHAWSERRRTEATLILWMPVAGFGLLLFVYMNVSIYGSPVAFLRPFAGTGDVFGSAHRGVDALLDHPLAVLTMAGWPVLVASLAGLAAYGWSRRASTGGYVPLLLLYPLAWFMLQATASGSIIEPAGQPEDWRNLRYAVTMLPALAFFSVVGPSSRTWALGAAFVLIAAGAAKAVTGTDAVWRDARADVPEAHVLKAASKVLSAEYDDRRVLILPHNRDVDRLQLYSGQEGIALNRFIDGNDAPWEGITVSGDIPSRLDVGWVVSIRDDETARFTAAARRVLLRFKLCSIIRSADAYPGTVVLIYRRAGHACLLPRLVRARSA